jgi:hypothetical protein
MWEVSTITFFLCLAGLALLIFGLSRASVWMEQRWPRTTGRNLVRRSAFITLCVYLALALSCSVASVLLYKYVGFVYRHETEILIGATTAGVDFKSQQTRYLLREIPQYTWSQLRCSHVKEFRLSETHKLSRQTTLIIICSHTYISFISVSIRHQI